MFDKITCLLIVAAMLIIGGALIGGRPKL